MFVKDLLEPEVITLNPTDTIVNAWAVMRDADRTGAVVVTDEGRIVGFLTDGDLIRSCMPSETDITIYDNILDTLELPESFIRQIRGMKVEDIMQSMDTDESTHDVITIDPDEPALKALALMYQHRLRRIPVTDGKTLMGSISRSQILSDLLLDRKLTDV